MGRLFCSPFLGRGDSPLLRCMKDFKTVAKTVEGNEGGKCHYNTRLDTYGCGCAHDCSYCYAKNLIMKLARSDEWRLINLGVHKCSSQKSAIDFNRESLRKVKTASFFYRTR